MLLRSVLTVTLAVVVLVPVRAQRTTALQELYRATSRLPKITAMDLAPLSSMLAVGSASGALEIYTLVDSTPSVRTIDHLGFAEINAIEFSIQAPRLIVGGAGDVFAGVLNTETWETEHLAAGDRVIDDVHDVGGVVFYLRDAAMRQVVMLDMTSSRPHVEFIAGGVGLVGHSIDRRRIALIDQGQAMLLDAATMRVLSRTGTQLGDGLTSIALVGQGYTALLGTTRGDLLILDVLDGRLVDTLAGAHTGPIRFIEVTEAGIYTAGDDGSVKRWTGYERHSASETVATSRQPVVGLGVSYAGEHVAVATADGTIRVFGPAPVVGEAPPTLVPVR